jgi:hypothetical protein
MKKFETGYGLLMLLPVLGLAGLGLLWQRESNVTPLDAATKFTVSKVKVVRTPSRGSARITLAIKSMPLQWIETSHIKVQNVSFLTKSGEFKAFASGNSTLADYDESNEEYVIRFSTFIDRTTIPQSGSVKGTVLLNDPADRTKILGIARFSMPLESI